MAVLFCHAFLKGQFCIIKQPTRAETNDLTINNMDAIPFVLIDESVLTNGMRVLVAGIDTSQFEKNPVMFYYHADYTLPIGRWTNIRKENGQLLADAEFDMTDEDKEVKRVIKKVEQGYIKMASAGLVDLELSDDRAYQIAGQTGYTVIRSRIRESSIVPIGRNHNAMTFRLYDADGKELNPAKPADALLLADFLLPKTNINNMSKTYLKFLNLGDDASDEMISAAVEKLQGDKEAAVAAANSVQGKLDALELADKKSKRDAFASEVDAAIKAGQIQEVADGSVKTSFLNLFDSNPEAARTTLGALPKAAKLKELNLGDNDLSEYKELEAMDYSAMDKSGKALLCHDKFPELYKEKYKAKFGVEPTN